MRFLFVSLLVLTAYAHAQSLGSIYYIPVGRNDVSGIVGVSTITDSGNGDIGLMTIQTVPNPTTTTTEPACVLPLLALSILVFLSLGCPGLSVDPPLLEGRHHSVLHHSHRCPVRRTNNPPFISPF